MKMCVSEAGWVGVLLEALKPSIFVVLIVNYCASVAPTAKVNIVVFQALCQFHYR